MPTSSMKADSNDAIILILLLENMQRFCPLPTIYRGFCIINIFYNKSIQRLYYLYKLNNIIGFLLILSYNIIFINIITWNKHPNNKVLSRYRIWPLLLPRASFNPKVEIQGVHVFDEKRHLTSTNYCTIISQA